MTTGGMITGENGTSRRIGLILIRADESSVVAFGNTHQGLMNRRWSHLGIPTKADKSAVCTINRHLRMGGKECPSAYSGHMGVRGILLKKSYYSIYLQEG